MTANATQRVDVERSKRRMPVGEWLFLHLVILPAYLAVGAGMMWGLLQLFKLLPRPL